MLFLHSVIWHSGSAGQCHCEMVVTTSWRFRIANFMSSFVVSSFALELGAHICLWIEWYYLWDRFINVHLSTKWVCGYIFRFDIIIKHDHIINPSSVSYMNDYFLMMFKLVIWGLVYKQGLTLITSWISNYIHYKVWDEISFALPNFNGERRWRLGMGK